MRPEIRKSRPSLSYARRVIFHNRDLDVVLVTWPPGSFSSAHDHGRSTGLIRVLEGTVFQKVFKKKSRLFFKRVLCRKNDVFLETPDIIHVMGNNSKTKKALTLHIYTPPLRMKNYHIS